MVSKKIIGSNGIIRLEVKNMGFDLKERKAEIPSALADGMND